MKLLTYTLAGESHLGALSQEKVIDLPQAYRAYLTAAARPVNGFPHDMLALLQAGPALLETAREVVRWVGAAGSAAGPLPYVRDLNEVQIEPPVPNPGKIICVGLNYADHCREQKLEIPKRPVLFSKFPTTLIGPEGRVTWSAEDSEQVDYEAELAVIIGRMARHVPAESAHDYIAGYTIANDVSARDVQFADVQWVRGKSFDTFCPLGPYLVTPDEVGDPQRLAIQCRVNGVVMQDSNTSEMIHQVPKLIEFISRTCTLLPGDVLCTGTPHGVGVFRDPQVFLKPGDVVEVEIEKLGCLRSPVG